MVSKINKILEYIDENKESIFSFLQKLVRTNSSNPFTPENSNPDIPIEKEVAYLIRDRIEEIGLHPKLYGVSKERPNVVVKYGRGHGKTLILDTHMDTVLPSPHYSFDPYSGIIKRNKLYGLGAADAKGVIATYIYLLQSLVNNDVELNGKLIVAFVVDEEPGACSKYGTQYLLEKEIINGDAAIVGEPGSSSINIGHRGIYRFKIRTFGESVHTGSIKWERGERGKNAIVEMAKIIEVLSNYKYPNLSSTNSTKYRRNVLTFPTIIKGGDSINKVPDFCEAYGDLRLFDETSYDTIERFFKSKISEIIDKNQYKIEKLCYVPFVKISENEKIVKILHNNATKLLGRNVKISIAGPANDGWMFIVRGIPAICGFGPSGGGVHAKDEWVDLKNLINVTKIYLKTIIDYIGIL